MRKKERIKQMRWKIRCGWWKSNRNTSQAAHTIWNDIDDGVHTYDAYVYFEDVGLTPPGAQHNLID